MQERSINTKAIPLDLSRPAAEQILTALRSAILEIRLEPGARISESEVARSFGASRTPVREAFTRLREDGLIITLPSRGTYVSKLSEVEIRGAQFVREALELSMVTKLCETGMTDLHRLSIEQTLNAQEQALAEDDGADFQEADDRFHMALARATGIGRLEVQLAREKAVLNRLRMLSLSNRTHISSLYAEHCAIFEAINATRADKATELMRGHLQHVLETLSDLHQSHEEYFENFGATFHR